MSADAAIETRDVHVAYLGDIHILRGLSLAAGRGRITGIIGPNGSGKSTALKTMCGFLKPRRGEVLIEGVSTPGLRPCDLAGRGVAYVPQARSVFGGLSVEDNLRLGCWSFRRERPRVAAALADAYGRFPILAERRRAPAASLSGGQQRLLEIARALVVSPRLLLLDEPTAMIAPRFAQEIYAFIESLPQQGVSVVLVDQNVRQCVRISDEVYILDLGTVRAFARRGDLAGEESLRAMIGDWLDYRVT